MFGKKRSKLFAMEKDNNFANRILALSLPSALVFIMLVALKLLPASIAVMAYSSIIIFNIVWLFPITFELQQIKKYIFRLTKEENYTGEQFDLTENDTREIVDAINEMHRFWTDKAEQLEAQTISDTAVLDTLPDPILMIDRGGNILGANTSARGLLGDDITDRKVEDIFSSNNFINAVTKVLRQESESENLIFYVNRGSKNNDLQKIYAHIKQLPWISKGRAVAVISLYDFAKATKIEKMQADFVANASHELRTPLSVISGFIETLQTTAKDDEKAREMFLKIMSEQANYMSLLIENLLSLSKIEMTQDLPPDEKISVIPIAEDVCNALMLKARARHMEFALKMAKDLPDITADYGQIRQLLQNLCDNAVKYGTENSVITITAKTVAAVPPSKTYEVAPGRAVAVSVHNFGEKISKEYVGRLTERFYRMQTHKNQNIKGSGLGLAIAKHILIRHRGNLRVKSDDVKGTTFTIYLPIKQNADDETALSSQPRAMDK